MRLLLDPVTKRIEQINTALSSLQATVAETGQQTFGEIANNIDNSFPEWSKAAYTTLGVLPADAGDTNLEAYNWYREQDTEVDITPDTTNPIKAPKTIEPADHTLWAANEGANADIPRWDKINGWFEMGGTAERWDLFCPLPNDVVLPGQTFYFQLEARLASGALPSGLQLYAGLYDNTAGQRKYIEGGSFTITGEIFGDQSGSTTVSYKVLARTDSGEEALSNTLTFTNAPAVFSQLNHPRVSFSGVAGFIEFLIYRQIGTDFVLQFTVRNAIEGTYFDVGNPPQAIVSAFPTVTNTKPRAFAMTTTFAPGSLNGTNFVQHFLTIFVPTTYDKSVTGPGQQFLRFGFTAFTSVARQLEVRKIGLSLGYGLWSRSANDVRSGVHSTPSTTTTGLPGGSGGIGIDPPNDGGGGPCVLLDETDIRRRTEAGFENRNIRALEKDDMLDTGGAVGGRVRFVKRAYSSRIYRLNLSNGLTLGCTFDHPLITDWSDMFGTAAETLKKRFDAGETVTLLTKPQHFIEVAEIIEMTEEFGDFAIGMPVMDGSHICITNGILSHNVKPIDQNQS
jgi:hypothetical protein